MIFASAVSRPTIERIKQWYSKNDSMEVIETKVINADFGSMDE